MNNEEKEAFLKSMNDDPKAQKSMTRLSLDMLSYYHAGRAGNHIPLMETWGRKSWEEFISEYLANLTALGEEDWASFAVWLNQE